MDKYAIREMVKPFIPKGIFRVMKGRYMKQQLQEWEKNGRPDPPPHIVKQMTIRDYQDKSGYNILIETGTFRGDMVEAQKRNFKKVISIELNVEIFKAAQRKFRNDKNVELVQGDSGEVLASVMAKIDEPAIFWLDGHYSAIDTAKGNKECPIYEEMDCIFGAKPLNHILLIDDANSFIGENDYPTFDALTAYVKSKNNKYKGSIENNIIRYVI